MSHRITTVTRLTPRALSLDERALASFSLHHRPAAVRASVFLAGEGLALCLARITPAFEHGNCTVIADEAWRLLPAARLIGLPDLVIAAEHVASCATTADGPALAATVARLMRLGEAALRLITDRSAPGR